MPLTSIDELAKEQGRRKGRREGFRKGLLLGIEVALVNKFREGLLLGIEVALINKFRDKGRKLLPRIRALQNTAKLEALAREIEIAPNVFALRRFLR